MRSANRWLGLMLTGGVACSPLAAAPSAATAEVEGPPPETQPSEALPSPVPPTDTAPGASFRAEGSAEYVAQAQAAFDLLAECAPEALVTIDQYIDVVLQSERSGMLADEQVFLDSDTTAFAPGRPVAAQVFWFAGAMVHDARHGYQRQAGQTISWDALTLEQRMEIEDDARGVQIEVMRACLLFVPEADRAVASDLVDYLQLYQDHAVPCDYCEVEWSGRDW